MKSDVVYDNFIKLKNKVLESMFVIINDYLSLNINSQKQHFIQSYKDICIDLKTQDKKIKFIQYSFLYTRLFSDKPLYVIEAYDYNWCFGGYISSGNYNPREVFLPWFETKILLEKEIKKYMGKITNYDVDVVMFETLNKIKQYIENIAKESVYICIDSKEHVELEKDSMFMISIGDYRSSYTCLYKG